MQNSFDASPCAKNGATTSNNSARVSELLGGAEIAPRSATQHRSRRSGRRALGHAFLPTAVLVTLTPLADARAMVKEILSDQSRRAKALHQCGSLTRRLFD